MRFRSLLSRAAALVRASWFRLAVGTAPLRAGIARGARAAYRPLSPVLSVPTAPGWCVIVAAPALWAIGLIWNWTEVVLLGLFLTVPLVIAVGCVIGRSTYSIQLDLTSTRVVVGERAVGRVTVANPMSRASLPSRIELLVGRSSAEFLVPRLEPGAEHEDLFAVPTSRRMVLPVGPVRSVRDDPLSLLRRTVTWTRQEQLYVHPRTVRLPGAAQGFLRDLEGTPSSDLSSSDIAFHALREYSYGDDRRHIHWRTTARTGRLMVRQFEETRRSHVVVALDDITEHYADAEEFELAVSTAASIAGETMREGVRLTAFTGSTGLTTRSHRGLMDGYTEAALSPARGRRLFDLGRRAADEAPGASAVLLVTGSRPDPRDLHSFSLQLPLGLVAVAFRCEEGARTALGSLGGLRLVTMGELAVLPRVVSEVGR